MKHWGVDQMDSINALSIFVLLTVSFGLFGFSLLAMINHKELLSVSFKHYLMH